MNTIGNIIKLTFFGESHGEYLGVVIDNLPAGIKIDYDNIDAWLQKRRPQGNLSTTRVEPDDWKIISGYLDGKTTGAAFTVLIKNQEMHSEDYLRNEFKPRPGHADYPAYVKYDGANDLRGGGIFSGRITALWMIVGAISEQILTKENIDVFSHIVSIKNVKSALFANDMLNNEFLEKMKTSGFPVISDRVSELMKQEIENAKKSGDSVGGIVETVIVGLPVGIGEPLFASCESVLSSNLFSIPGIKGVEFGSGFAITEKLGSEANDPYRIQDGKIITTTNHNGGIVGGISTGMPLVFRVAVKPTPSISKEQKTVDLSSGTNSEIEVSGRHDPSIVPRVIPVISAVASFTILDLLLLSRIGRSVAK